MMQSRVGGAALQGADQPTTWRAYAALAMTLALILVTPWFTALFFAPAHTIAAGIVGIVCLGIMSYRRIEVDIRSPETWVIGLGLYTALTNLWAVSPAGSVEVTCVEIAGLLTFLVAQRHAGLIGRWLPVAFGLVAIALEIFGMGAGVNLWKSLDAVYDGHQLASVFEYHNTFGAVELGAGLIAYMSLAVRARIHDADDESGWLSRSWRSMIGTAVLIISVAAVLASESRVVWVMTPIAILLMIIGLALNDRDRAAWATIRTVITSAVGAGVGFLSIKALDSTSVKYFILSIVLALLVAVVMSVLDDYFTETRLKRRDLLAGGVLVVVVLGGGLYELLKHFSHSSTAVASRISTISLGSVSLQERFYYYKDAFHMWLNSPIFGGGGGTWNAEFQSMQSLPYWSRQVHSVLFDQLLDGGIVGFALYIGVFVVVAIRVVRYLRSSQDVARRRLVLAFTLGSLVMWGHAFIDFDFSFGYYQFAFWAMLATASGLAWMPRDAAMSKARTEVAAATAAATTVQAATSEAPAPGATAPGAAPAAPLSASAKKRQQALEQQRLRREAAIGRVAVSTWVLVAAFCGAFGLTLGMSQSDMQAATAASQAQNPDTAYADEQSAAAWAPYDSAPQLALAQYYFTTAQSSNDRALYTNAMQEAVAAAGDAPWDPSVQTSAALIAYQLGNDPLAVQWAQKSYADGHFNETYLRNLLGISMWYGAQQMKQNPAFGRQELEHVLQLYAAYHASESVINQRLFPDSTPLTEDASMQVYIGTADYLLHHYKESLAVMNPLLMAARDQAAVALYMIDTVLDDAALHQTTKTSKAYLTQILSQSAIAQEYNFLKQV